MSEDEWSLKGRYGITDYGNKIYTEEDIEILHEKLIEDFKTYDKKTHWLYGDFSKGAEEIINKRFDKNE